MLRNWKCETPPSGKEILTSVDRQKHQRLTFKPDDRADILEDIWTTVVAWATNPRN